jgi:NADH-quinone oxidoreductase subunit L
VKSALAYASLTQVGLIVAEIGCGLRYIPLVHIIGHACLRTLQLLRAPTLLHDYRLIENALGGHQPRTVAIGPPSALERWRRYAYWLAHLRGGFDAALDDYVVRPTIAVFRWCDRMERRWTDLLAGAPSREPTDLTLGGGVADDIL